MSKTPKFDAKIQTILDATTPGESICALTCRTWKVTEKDLVFSKRFMVPVPDWHPEVLLNYLNGFNTGLAVFWNKDSLTGKPIISAIHPDNPIPVTSEEEFSKNDFSSVSQDVQIDKSVFDQIWSLKLKIPHIATRNVDVKNSIAIASNEVRDSYLACGSFASSGLLYSYALAFSEDSIDCVNSEHIYRSYQVTGSRNIFDSQFIYESVQCQSSGFLFDCWNCEFCFGATNKRNKKYLWMNEQLSKEEWEKQRKAIDFSDVNQTEYWKNYFYELWKKDGIWPQAFSIGNIEAEGEHMYKSVRCEDCFWQISSHDSLHMRFGLENKNSLYTSGQGREQDTCFSAGGGNGAKNKFCLGCNSGINLEYCFNCSHCENCFGCVGLVHKQFHIFNKLYSEEEYWQKVDELKCAMLERGEYGKFFPAKFSPNGFQYSVGQIYFGYSEHDLDIFQAPRFDPKRGQVLAPNVSEDKIIKASDLPKKLSDVDPAKYINRSILDEEIDRSYSILPKEFSLYQQRKLPLPRQHFVTRLCNLIRHSNSPIRKQAVCTFCSNEIETYLNLTFSERKILCKSCYLQYLEEKG